MSMTKKNMRAALMVALGGFMLATQVPVWGMEKKIEAPQKPSESELKEWQEAIDNKGNIFDFIKKKKEENDKKNENKKESEEKEQIVWSDVLDRVLYYLDDSAPEKKDLKKADVKTANDFVYKEIACDLRRTLFSANDKNAPEIMIDGLAGWFIEKKKDEIWKQKLPGIFKNICRLLLYENYDYTCSYRLARVVVAVGRKDLELAKVLFNALDEKEVETSNNNEKKIQQYTKYEFFKDIECVDCWESIDQKVLDDCRTLIENIAGGKDNFEKYIEPVREKHNVRHEMWRTDSPWDTKLFGGPGPLFFTWGNAVALGVGGILSYVLTQGDDEKKRHKAPPFIRLGLIFGFFGWAAHLFRAPEMQSFSSWCTKGAMLSFGACIGMRNGKNNLNGAKKLVQNMDKNPKLSFAS